MKEKLLIWIAVLIVSVFMGTIFWLSGCAPSAEETAFETSAVQETEAETAEAKESVVEKVAITYWHTMSDAEEVALKKVIEMFEEQYPNIKIEPTRVAYDDFKPALLTGIAGEVVPDTARLDIIWVPEFAEMGALVALDKEMEGFDEIIANTYPGPTSTNFWKGHYYGLPQDTNTQVLVWNKQMFKEAGLSEPPQTIDEFVEYATLLSNPDEEVYGYTMGGTYFWAPAPIFYAMGGEITDPEITTATGYINGEKSVAAYQLLVDMYKDGSLSPYVLGGGGVGAFEGLATSKYAMIIEDPWAYPILKSDYPEFEVNFTLVPKGPDGTTSSVVGGQNVVIFEGSQHKDEAIEWAKFLLSEEAQLTIGETGAIPTLTTVQGNERLPEYYDVFMEQLKTAKARLPHPKWSEIDNVLNNAFQYMLRGEKTVQQALDDAAEEINKLIVEG
ncbi:MAG: extracellular solute-binding protein [Actinobacteria bacterium]|nr:extracellular solute-binding protein [Actinomycetota bacterium]